MIFTDIDYHKIKKEVGGFCMKRTPAHLKDKLRYEYEVADQNVIIYEIRPVWNRKDEHTKLPVAKLTYVNARKIWKLYWVRGSGKWEKYEPLETALDLNALIREIDKDSYGCFFG